MDIFQEDLKELRAQLSAIDNDVVALLSKRKAITDKIFQFKHEQQSSAYVESNERAIISWRKKVAAEHNVNETLIEDVFRLVMYDAYHSTSVNYPKVAKAEHINNIALIGNNNLYADFFQKLFNNSGYQTEIITDLASQKSDFLLSVDVLIVTEPIKPVLNSLSEQFKVPASLLIVDLSMINMESIDYLMTHHAGPSLGLHPMFSPSVKGLNKEVIFLCHGNLPTKYIWLVDQLKMWGVKVLQTSPTEHDNLMLITSSLNQFFVFLHAKYLVDQNISLKTLLNSSGPSYRLSLMMLGRYFSKAKPLKAKRFFNPEAINLFKQCNADITTFIALLEKNDQAAFAKQYHEIQQWFAQYANAFDQESNRLSRLQPLNPLDELIDDELFEDE